MVPVLFTFYIQGVLKLKKNNSGAKRLTARLQLVPSFRMNRAILPRPPYAFMAWRGKKHLFCIPWLQCSNLGWDTKYLYLYLSLFYSVFFRHLRLIRDSFFYTKLKLLFSNIPTSGASAVGSACRFREEPITTEPAYNNNGLYDTPTHRIYRV